MKPTLAVLALIPLACGSHRLNSEPPHVLLTLSTTHSTCAESPRTHNEFGGTQHRHVVVFATARGLAQPDDIMAVTVSGREIRMPASHGTVSVDFPAGIGLHDISAEWTDAAGVVKHRSETALRVYEWAMCEAM